MNGLNKMKSLFAASQKRGLPPGTMVYTGKRKDEPLRITMIDYSPDKMDERVLGKIEDDLLFKSDETVSWINIDGLNDTPVIEKIGETFGIHPLVLEDILHTNQRPKLEDNTDYLFLVVRMLYLAQDSDEVQSEQVSFILTETGLITFQERAGDVFDGVRDRIQKSYGRIRKAGPDYLLYALMDSVVDNYFFIMEAIGEKIGNIEQSMLENPNSILLNELYQMKRELLYIRKAVWPLREAFGALERAESGLLRPSTGAYLRDLYDHTIQLIDMVETFRDMLGGVQDLYLSSMGQKTNQVMQVLTIIATIFIPLTFFAGIYGMNFEHMPELSWKYSYPLFWIIILALAAVMGAYFRRKKWF